MGNKQTKIMINSNINLGYYDMVLSLSENKINQEFDFLFRQKKIKSEFNVMSNIHGNERMISSDPGFASIKQDWLKTDRLLQEQISLKNQVDTLTSEVSKALKEKRFGEAAAIDEQKDTIIQQEKFVSSRLTALQKFDVMVDAIIKSPKVEIVENEHFSLLFILEFERGTLNYIENNVFCSADLAGKSYAFTVPIGKVKISKDEMYITGDKEKTLRDSGFTEDDFTIESIFLNFNDVNISSFSTTKSNLPDVQKTKTFLLLSITNYFKALSDTENPYVLGYAIKKRTIKATERAMLYPTGASFSTSKSIEARASSFNFLMLVNNNKFPTVGGSGILKHNLIEKSRDKSSGGNGTIAINYPTFRDIYLKELNQAVIDNFDSSFKKNQPQLYYGIINEMGYTKFVFIKGGLKMFIVLHEPRLLNKIKSDGSTALEIQYPITVDGKKHEEISKKVFGFSAGTVGVDQRFSSEGRYEIDGQTGKHGKLTLFLQASVLGQLAILSEYINPTIGNITESVEYKDTTDKIWDTLSYFLDPLETVEGLKMLFSEKGRNIIQFDQSTFSKVEFNNLNNFSNRVILPGSNTYTFKNIRSMTDEFNDQDAILFDISYAPTTNK